MSTVNALVAAARDGDLRQIKTLAKQCDVNAKDELGWCATELPFMAITPYLVQYQKAWTL